MQEAEQANRDQAYAPEQQSPFSLNINSHDPGSRTHMTSGKSFAAFILATSGSL